MREADDAASLQALAAAVADVAGGEKLEATRAATAAITRRAVELVPKAHDATTLASLARRGRRRIRRSAPSVEAVLEQCVVAIAYRDDVLAHDGLGVVAAHAADADGRDVHEIARRRHALAEHVTRHDHERRRGGGRRLRELAPRDA